MLRKPEGIRRSTVPLVMVEALATFGDRRNVADGNPPKAIDGLVHFLEPFGAIAKDAGVLGFVGEVAQRLKRLPDGHIEEDGSVLGTIDDVRGVARSGLQAPDETEGAVGERVDGIELSDEFGDLGIVDGSKKTPDVNLREMVAHGRFPP